MNSILVLVVGIGILIAGYVFYGKWLAGQWGVDPDGFRFFYGYSSAVSSLEAFMITAHCLHPCATKDSPSARLSQTPWEVKRKNSLSSSLT